MTTKADWLRSEIEKWKKNASYLAKRLKQQNYKDAERHFEDFTESALTSIITRYKEELKVLESK